MWWINKYVGSLKYFMVAFCAQDKKKIQIFAERFLIEKRVS